MADEQRFKRHQRLDEFMRRLQAQPALATFEEAWECLSRTLNEVEDELTDIPYNPSTWNTDGRLYPPQEDNIRTVSDRPHVKRLRSRQHNIYIADNGAIEIRVLVEDEETVVFSKPGRDGRNVWQT